MFKDNTFKGEKIQLAGFTDNKSINNLEDRK